MRKTRARLKLLSAQTLAVRFVDTNDHVRNTLGALLTEVVPVGAVFSDGEIYTVTSAETHAPAVLKALRPHCELIYDPNLIRESAGLPNPWRIPTEPLRDRSQRQVIYMARVWHPEFAESIAFQSPHYDDDFMLALRGALRNVKRWTLVRKDLDRVPIWVVADHYEPVVHDVLDRYYDCQWDEFFAGDEWNVLPPPANSQYTTRRLSAREFELLGVRPFCSIVEATSAYSDRKAEYEGNQIHVDEWMDIDLAYQRIRAHPYETQEQELPEVVAAPREITLMLRTIFPGAPDTAEGARAEEERVRWYYTHNPSLGGIPADIVAGEPDGEQRVVRYLQLMQLMQPATGT
jgi:hypothetical protein